MVFLPFFGELMSRSYFEGNPIAEGLFNDFLAARHPFGELPSCNCGKPPHSPQDHTIR
jgi:hypothetical protein